MNLLMLNDEFEIIKNKEITESELNLVKETIKQIYRKDKSYFYNIIFDDSTVMYLNCYDVDWYEIEAEKFWNCNIFNFLTQQIKRKNISSIGKRLQYSDMFKTIEVLKENKLRLFPTYLNVYQEEITHFLRTMFNYFEIEVDTFRNLKREECGYDTDYSDMEFFNTYLFNEENMDDKFFDGQYDNLINYVSGVLAECTPNDHDMFWDFIFNNVINYKMESDNYNVYDTSYGNDGGFSDKYDFGPWNR